jgi:heme A synthase
VPRFARFAWSVLVYNIAVVLWGAFVRATGSGAGCGPNWPLCNAVIADRSPSVETLIEFTHRAMSGIDVALVAMLVVWAYRAFPPQSTVRLGATLSGIFLVVEALLGAALVLLEHVAKNTSSARAWSMSTHLVNTLVLLACLTLTAWWGMGNPGFRVRGRGARSAFAALLVFVLLGVTGAIAALGDTLFPAQSLAEGLAQDLNPASNLFVRLRWLHPLVAAVGGTWLMLTTLAGARNPSLAPMARAAAALLALQLVVGAINLLLLAPVWLQLVHLLVADAAWVALVLLFATRSAKETA